MATQASTKDDLLTEFEDLINRIGKEVASESLSPVLKDLLTTWQASVDNHQQYMTQLVTSLVDKMSTVDGILSKLQSLCEQLDSLPISMGEEWRSSLAVLKAGYDEVIEKTDVPSVLRTFSGELEQYQKLRGELEDACKEFGEVYQLFLQEMRSYGSLIQDSVAELKRTLERGIQDLKESGQVVGQRISSLQVGVEKLSKEVRDNQIQASDLWRLWMEKLSKEVCDQVAAARRDASSRYSEICAQQEQVGTSLSSMARTVDILKAGQETFLGAIEDLAAKQQAIAHRIAIATWLGTGSLLTVIALLIHLVVR